jgi:hypothetical protein
VGDIQERWSKISIAHVSLLRTSAAILIAL